MKLDKYIVTPIAEVAPARKQTHYTISDIGGPEAHAAWLAQQKILEEAYQAKMAPIRAQMALEAAQMVAKGAGDYAARKLTPEERAEALYTARQNIADHRQEPHRFVTEAQNEAAKRANNPPPSSYQTTEEFSSTRSKLGKLVIDFISKAFEK